MPIAHMTELEAVNQMLLSIGESPVTSTSNTYVDAQVALTTLRNVSREIQAQGWHCNTTRDKSYAPDEEGDIEDEIQIAADVLKIDTVTPTTRNRSGASLHSSRGHNASMRRDPTDTYWALYDVDNSTFGWSNVSTLIVDEVIYKDYDVLTPLLQHYVFTEAARRFQVGYMANQVLYRYTTEMVQEAAEKAFAEEAENEDYNLFEHNAGIAQGAYRRNHRWGS